MAGSALLVVAFDFGTTYSGYAFSFRDDPLKIQTNQKWIAGSDQLISLKTPTCVLLDPNGQFDSFGYEAENHFATLVEDKEHQGWRLFRRFKMILHNNKDLSRSTTVEDINGKSIPAMTIFTMSIKYLKKHFTEALNKQKTGIVDEDIQYVITVPAIWNDNAKQFMREAAENAGIEKARLKLSFEPEAASIWCQTISTDVKETWSKAGRQYMVIDLGGGTADISVHEKQIDDTLKELHKASGGPWGGTVVDNNYLEWLTKIFGNTTMQRFKNEQMEDYFQLLRDFEIKKRGIGPESKGKITFRLSASMKELYQEESNRVPLEEKIDQLGLSGMVTLTSDKMRVEVSVIKQLFETPIHCVIEHVQQIFAKPNMQKVETILLVGGFGECKLAQNLIQKEIKKKKIIIPEEAGIVVLKGAVRFGHFQGIVRSRIMAHTYGLSVCTTFVEQKHKNAEVIFIDGVKEALNIFTIMIRAGKEVNIGEIISTGPLTPIYPDETNIIVYCTEEIDPEYTTDIGCKHIGTLIVKHSNGKSKADNQIKASFIFGDTELLVKAVNIRTKEEFSTYMDCL
ncbi:heat shock 70 kDa protein 12B-like [Ruditapes philippinarum]|uniref:heat shock 70 kDa protein 12B-like n=1 Tax=Ruditapes philippinarum TaxID=129788 RepID=UPI00295B90DB|nr:heat shock 70 kDa protein 12B-like [Ruditapes philippinarum]XP_060596204.1 heat shock 70 kDa protein 12B-like [Ruditapes philippinarum]